MNDFKFTQEQIQDAMFRATDWGHIPYLEQRFIILQFIESLKKCSDPTERMYSRAEMRHSFESGYKRSEYDSFDRFFHDPASSFLDFIESLNTPKP